MILAGFWWSFLFLIDSFGLCNSRTRTFELVISWKNCLMSFDEKIRKLRISFSQILHIWWGICDFSRELSLWKRPVQKMNHTVFPFNLFIWWYLLLLVLYSTSNVNSNFQLNQIVQCGALAFCAFVKQRFEQNETELKLKLNDRICFVYFDVIFHN